MHELTDGNLEMETERLEDNDSTNHIEIEFRSLKSEVELPRSMIEIAETKHQLLISLIILSFIFSMFSFLLIHFLISHPFLKAYKAKLKVRYFVSSSMNFKKVFVHTHQPK